MGMTGNRQRRPLVGICQFKDLDRFLVDAAQRGSSWYLFRWGDDVFGVIPNASDDRMTLAAVLREGLPDVAPGYPPISVTAAIAAAEEAMAGRVPDLWLAVNQEGPRPPSCLSPRFVEHFPLPRWYKFGEDDRRQLRLLSVNGSPFPFGVAAGTHHLFAVGNCIYGVAMEKNDTSFALATVLHRGLIEFEMEYPTDVALNAANLALRQFGGAPVVLADVVVPERPIIDPTADSLIGSAAASAMPLYSCGDCGMPVESGRHQTDLADLAERLTLNACDSADAEDRRRHALGLVAGLGLGSVKDMISAAKQIEAFLKGEGSGG